MDFAVESFHHDLRRRGRQAVSNALKIAAALGVAAGDTDPNFANVSLLLHCDGTDGSTTFTDHSPNAFTMTANGNAQIDTAQSKFGGASALFDGSGDWVSAPSDTDFTFGTGDFTIEAWIYVTSTTYETIWCTGAGGTPWLGVFSGALFLWTGAGLSGGTVTTNTWHHVAATRSGTTARIFLNGTQVNSSTVSTNFTASGSRTGGGYDSPTADLNGNIDDVRITKGVARYTANFTPPTAAFPDS